MGKVLVVDDEKDLRETLMDIVSLIGHETVGAGDGLEALDILKTQSFDFIISDVQMPHCTGTQLILACVKLGITTPFIFLSGDDTFKSELKSVRNIGITFLPKPIDFETLVSILSEAA